MTPRHWQGIVTKYLPPTNHRPARVRACSRFHAVTVNWDSEFGVYENHEAGARALTYKMGQGRPAVVCGPEWELVGVESPHANGYVFIMFEAPSSVVGCVRRLNHE